MFLTCLICEQVLDPRRPILAQLCGNCNKIHHLHVSCLPVEMRKPIEHRLHVEMSQWN